MKIYNEPIMELMRKRQLPNPYEIKMSDVGKSFGTHDFGDVILSDVGKLVHLKKNMLFMENTEQMMKRLRKN